MKHGLSPVHFPVKGYYFIGVFNVKYKTFRLYYQSLSYIFFFFCLISLTQPFRKDTDVPRQVTLNSYMFIIIQMLWSVKEEIPHNLYIKVYRLYAENVLPLCRKGKPWERLIFVSTEKCFSRSSCLKLPKPFTCEFYLLRHFRNLENWHRTCIGLLRIIFIHVSFLTDSELFFLLKIRCLQGKFWMCKLQLWRLFYGGYFLIWGFLLSYFL